MRVLCCDAVDASCSFVFDVSAAYYDGDVNGLVLTPCCPSFCDFCFPDMHISECNAVIYALYRDGFCDLLRYGKIQLYSDLVPDTDGGGESDERKCDAVPD